MVKKDSVRSPFALELRAARQRRGLSQANLVERISRRAATDPGFAALGMISGKTISNLEAPAKSPARFVRPRAHTVRLLATALELEPGSDEEAAFFAAAEETRQRNAGDGNAPATFVRAGREPHIEALQAAWQLARDGSPQVVFVAGEAGGGKTSLIVEVITSALKETPTARIAWGECTSGAQSVEPYLPFRQGMSRLLGMPGLGPAPVETTERPWPDEALQHLITGAFKLGGVLIDERALQHRMNDGSLARQAEMDTILNARSATDTTGRFDQFATLLSGLANSWPIIIVLEDLHWADQATTSLLLHLQRRLGGRQNVPILIIGTYRPTDLDARDEDRHPLQPVINEITRLSGRPVIDLSTAMLPTSGRAFIVSLLARYGLPDPPRDELADLLERRTSGHPLFVVELLRWLQEVGSLEHRGGKWRFSPPANVTDIPSRIRGVIEERIDRLPRRVRRVLDIASVQGTTASTDVIARISGISPDELDAILDDDLVATHQLLRSGRVFPVAGQRFHTYDFTHALFQEYLYEALSPARRERLHRQTAEQGIDLLGESSDLASGEFSFHFARAHMPAEAAKHAMQASTNALKRLNYDLAGFWLDRTAIYAEEAGDFELACGARAGKIEVHRGTGDLATAFALAEEVLQECVERGFPQIEAQCHDLIAHIHFDRNELADAIEHLGLAVTLHRRRGELAAASGSEAMLSHCWYRMGAYDEALRHARASWRNARDAGHDGFAGEALIAAGNCEIDLGRYEAAIETYARAEPIYARTGEIRGQILAGLNSGLCRVQLGEWEAALKDLAAARNLLESTQTPRLFAALDLYTGLAHEGAGDLAAAAEHYDASLQRRLRLGRRNDIADNLAGLLRVALARKNDADIRRLRQELTDWFAEFGEDGIEDPPLVLLTLAQAHDALGDETCRDAVLREGVDLLDRRAANISDEDARRSYLERVPTNRRLRQMHDRHISGE